MLRNLVRNLLSALIPSGNAARPRLRLRRHPLGSVVNDLFPSGIAARPRLRLRRHPLGSVVPWNASRKRRFALLLRSHPARYVVFIATSVVLIIASLLTMHIGVRADQNQASLLNGNSVPLIAQAKFLQAANSNQHLNLSIGLQLRNASNLDNLLSAIYNSQSSQYHHYLTPDEFNQLFAPTSDQVQQVVAYLQSQGLTVSSVAPNNLLIDATATVAQVQQAFNTQINNYQVGNHTFYANAMSPSVPASIGQYITSIGGLDNSVQYQPLYQRLASHQAALSKKNVVANLAVAGQNRVTSQNHITTQNHEQTTTFAGPTSGYGPQ